MVMVPFLLCIMITPCLIILVHTGQLNVVVTNAINRLKRVQQANDEKNDKIQQIENKKVKKKDQHGTINCVVLNHFSKSIAIYIKYEY